MCVFIPHVLLSIFVLGFLIVIFIDNLIWLTSEMANFQHTLLLYWLSDWYFKTKKKKRETNARKMAKTLHCQLQHTYTYIHTHTRTSARTHTHTHIHVRARMHTCTRKQDTAERGRDARNSCSTGWRWKCSISMATKMSELFGRGGHCRIKRV